MYQVAVILTDAERHILWVNRDFENITGYALEEVIGKSPGRLLQGPDTEPDAIARIRKGLAGRQVFKDTITNYRKNGEAYECRLVIHPIVGRNDEIVNYLAFEVDGGTTKNENRISLMNLNTRYRTSSLRGMDEVRLFERIKRVMEDEKLYLNPDLTLKRMAVHLDTNTKYLSQVINHQGEMNFLTFVNGYRIKDVIALLLQGEYRRQTYFGIAQQCGFKNKSTFYKVFRDMTGKTPKAYAEDLSREVEKFDRQPARSA